MTALKADSQSPMELDAILAALEENSTQKFPHEAVKQAIAHKEKITPLLLRTLEDTKTNLKEIAQKPSYFLHLYALFLLAQFKETRAYPLIVDLFSVPGEIVEDIAGDIITESLGQIIASVYDGDLAPIKRLIEDPDVYESVRVAGFSALETLVAQNVLPRESVLDYFKHLFSTQQKEGEYYFLSMLVISCIDLCPDEELLTIIRSAFEKDLIDEMLVVIEEVEEALEMDPEEALAKLREQRHYRFVEDAIAEMEWWACFREEEFRTVRSTPSSLFWTPDTDRAKKAKAKRKKKRTMQKQARKQSRAKKKKKK